VDGDVSKGMAQSDSKITKGGTYNPLTVYSSAISRDFSRFLFTVGARIPAQVWFFIGSFCWVFDLLVVFRNWLDFCSFFSIFFGEEVYEGEMIWNGFGLFVFSYAFVISIGHGS